MAFQPYYLKNRPSAFDHISSGMDSFGNAILDAQKAKQEREQLALQNLRNAGQDKRLAQSDYQNTLLKAQELIARDDLEGARALMAPHGAQQQQRAVEDSDWSAQGAAQPAVTAGEKPSQPMEALTDPNAIGEQTAAEDWASSSKPQLNKLQQAVAADKEKQRRMVTVLTGRGPNGEQWTLDPEAVRSSRLKRMDEASAQYGGGGAAKELYPQMRMVAQATGEALDPKEMFGQFRQYDSLKSQEDRADARERMRIEAEERRNEEWFKRFGVAEAGRNSRHADTQSSRPDAETKAIEKNQKVLNIEQDYETTAQRVIQNYKYADLRQGRGKLLDLATAVAGADENAALAAITAGAFTKMAQGGSGVVSDNDLRVFWGNIGGLGVRTEQAFRDAIDGKLGPDKQKAVQAAVNTLIASSDRRSDEIGQAIANAVGRLPGGQERVPGILKVWVPSYAARLEAQEKKAKAAAQPGGDPRDKYQRILRGDDQ